MRIIKDNISSKKRFIGEAPIKRFLYFLKLFM